MKDRFSGHAKQYAAFRPTYPAALYDFVVDHVKHFEVAWDAGTGNGQGAGDLCKKFKQVWATDISEKQLENAFQAPNILYSKAGEVTDFPGHSVDLITVAQAIHWFNREKFYEEVKRVGRPGSLLAVWGYGLLGIEPEIDMHLIHFYTKVVGPYWDAERKLVDEQYRTIAFPFEEIPAPSFRFSLNWTLEDLEGYLNTWSSVQKYIQANHANPVGGCIEKISPLWRSGSRIVNFPLFLRIGKL